MFVVLDHEKLVLIDYLNHQDFHQLMLLDYLVLMFVKEFLVVLVV